MTITGKMIEIGNIEMRVKPLFGFVLDTANGLVQIEGLTKEEIKAVKHLFGEHVVITTEAKP